MTTEPQALSFCLEILCVGVITQSFELLQTPRVWSTETGFRLGVSYSVIPTALKLRVFLSAALLVILLSGQALTDSLPAILLVAVWLIGLLFYWKLGSLPSGGSDSMTNLVLLAATLGQLNGLTRASIFFIAVQSLLSYFISGVVKIRRPEWRNGLALQVFLENSIYGNTHLQSKWICKKNLMLIASWGLILSEILMPLLIFKFQSLLLISFFLGISFHLFNAYWFGINRFVYSWIATYPAVYFAVSNYHLVSMS